MSAPLRVRVTVLDTWDTTPIEVDAGATVAELKLRALVANNVARDPSEYGVKYRGAGLRDESVTLRSAGVVDNAPLIVLPYLRRPAK